MRSVNNAPATTTKHVPSHIAWICILLDADLGVSPNWDYPFPPLAKFKWPVHLWWYLEIFHLNTSKKSCFWDVHCGDFYPKLPVFRFQSSGHPTSSHCGGLHRRRGSDFFFGTTFQHEVGFSANRLSQKSNMCWINMSCNFVGCIPLHHHCIPNSRSALLLVSIGGLRGIWQHINDECPVVNYTNLSIYIYIFHFSSWNMFKLW